MAMYNPQRRQEIALKAAMKLGLGVGDWYRLCENRLRRRADRLCVTDYDDRNHSFIGGDLDALLQRNYEKSLRLMWKSEIHAPYLGMKDATREEKIGHQLEGSPEIREMVEIAESDKVRKEFQSALSPDEREAIAWIMSMIVHGEAYALYTSASLLPVVRGTGSKLGMAMQSMEEAKHYIVLRAMVKTLAGLKPLHNSARIFFEAVARSSLYDRLFGMNIIIESFATQIFGEFADLPGLRHILPQFHLDESRHCAFPQTYFKSGQVPRKITQSRRHRRQRTILLTKAAPIIWDYRPHFSVLGREAFEFFGKFLSKASLLAERSGLPLLGRRGELLGIVNLLMNGYLLETQSEKYNGFKDYCLLKKGDLRGDIEAVEEEVFGEELYGSAQPLYWKFYTGAVETMERIARTGEGPNAAAA